MVILTLLTIKITASEAFFFYLDELSKVTVLLVTKYVLYRGTSRNN